MSSLCLNLFCHTQSEDDTRTKETTIRTWPLKCNEATRGQKVILLWTPIEALLYCKMYMNIV